jgi:hypothetical protein
MKTDEHELTAQLPTIGEAVWAECKDVWILAYVDAIGIWRAVADDQPLKIPAEGISNWLPRHYHRPAFVSSSAHPPSFLCSFAV